ncbi:MAG: hypothetical protein DWI48_01805 [Chloroflexi bacterium]|nr:MAG: hypothetical protein DWI48_01805 [Chloroflexota bacterium]
MTRDELQALKSALNAVGLDAQIYAAEHLDVVAESEYLIAQAEQACARAALIARRSRFALWQSRAVHERWGAELTTSR